MLVAFGKHDNSTEAFEVLRTTLVKRRPQITRPVGFRGGNLEKGVTWHARAGIWCLLDTEEVQNRFWCCFGVQDPEKEKSLEIAVEINPRLRGTDLLVGGAFALDVQGGVHLCHNGKIGGGRPGVGKTAFFDHYRDELTKMQYERGIVDVVDLGPISSPELPERIARFAREVMRIKAEITATSSRQAASPLS